jgi:hypothetical protein
MRVPSKIVLSALLLLAAALVLLGGVGFFRKVQTFQPSGLEVERRAEGWLVAGVEGEPATPPVERGDVILLVNGSLVENRVELERRLTRRHESTLLVMRGDRVETLTYERPPLRLDAPFLVLALIGVVYLLIGFYTLTREASRQVVLFCLWCLSSAAVYLLSPRLPPLDFVDQAIFVVEEIARLALPPLTLHFFLLFPRPFVDARWLRRSLPFLYLPASALLFLQLDLIAFSGRLASGPPTEAKLAALDLVELYLLVLCGFASILVLMTHLLRGGRWEEGRQVLWITLGMAGGYMPFLALYLFPTSMGLEAPAIVATLAVVPLALVPLSFAYAILRYRLWDIAIIVRDVTTYTLTLLLGIFGFSLLNLLIHRGIPEDLIVARNVMTFLAGLLVAGLLIPTKQGISSTLQRFHYRRSFSRRRALSQFGHDLLHERDLERLCHSLLQEVEEALDLELCNLYLVSEERLEPVREDESPADFEATNLDQDLWSADVEVLSELAASDVPGSTIELFSEIGYRYVFPLTVRGRRIGLFVAGHREGHVPLTSDDRDLIRQLLDQTALAIENAQLLETLQRQLDEVQELKQFNEEIIESSPAGIAVLDDKERIVSANLAFAAIVGVERSAARRRKLSELLPLERVPSPEDGLLEISYRGPHGREHHLQLSAAVFLGSSRALLGEPGAAKGLRVLVVHDVTDRVRMEKALEEKERLAALGIMAAGVAHEVNTPLTGISSYAQMLLAETEVTDPRYQLLRKVERQTFRAARIVNNLLELARSRQPDPEPVAVDAVMTECLDLLRERFASQGIDVAWSEPSEPAFASANESELHQVFNNLLINAIDAMETTGGTLTATVNGDGDSVVVTIEDTGIGITDELLPQIFQPFVSTKVKTGGTGLGLSLSYEMVRRAGGEIEARNLPAGGCSFTVRLPRVKKPGKESHEHPGR